jgi:cytochrome c553
LERVTRGKINGKSKKSVVYLRIFLKKGQNNMKRLTVLSIVAASLLLVGCNESSTGAEAKAATSTATEHAGKAVEATKEATAGHAEKAVEATKEAASEAKDAVVEKAAEVKEAVTEKAAAASAAVAGAATAAVEKTKEAASAVTEKATEAVADAKEAVSGGSDGKALFAKCAGCHGADGKTAALGKSAVIAGQAAADLETKIAGYKAGTLNTAGMGTLMKGQVATYSDADIKAVATFISGL